MKPKDSIIPISRNILRFPAHVFVNRTKTSRRYRAGFAAVALTLGFSSFASASVVAVSSSFELDARSSVAYGAPVIENSIASQGSAINSLNPNSVVAIANSGASTVSTFAAGNATWNSTADGTVQFDDIGWQQTLASGTVSSSGTHFGTQWSYKFIADVTGLFTLNYDISIDPATTNPFALLGFAFSLGYQDNLAVGTSGTKTRNIYAGQTYEVKISSRAGVSGGASKTALMDGAFNWSMDSGPPEPVPEPAPLALLTVGLLLFFARYKKYRSLSQTPP